MKFKFKKQQFQTDAVNSVVECFAGQPNESSQFILDRRQIRLDRGGYTPGLFLERGFKNRPIDLPPQEILTNIQKVQRKNGLSPSSKLEGEYNLTVEMETGTGKTYVYIKTMFELFKKYGWNKFIVVVPSIAIREGVRKSLEITESHFMEQYGHKARYFIYNSQHLHKIDQFASDPGLNVMIINTQAFNARSKASRRINMELDDFQSRKPIDVIAQTNPVVIIDEPQSVEGQKTKEALKSFNPLFKLRYSATHREEYNKVYRLDAMDAYNKKIVKKINVKGITVKGSTGTDGYLYLEGIDVSKKHHPLARLEFEKRGKNQIQKIVRKVSEGDNIFELSNSLNQYKGYTVSEINGANNTLEFSNGVILSAGDAQGDVNEKTLRRIQIRETIKSHLEKEKENYFRGIKVLSLFFIDEVAKYRKYDKMGNPLNGEYAEIFEEEYLKAVGELIKFKDNAYYEYLRKIDFKKTHNGYFSIDKKGRLSDPKVNKRETESDDEDAYNLIMRDKERLLSFDEPTRFIFSHSALKEGWDNTNVFQICTLKHSDSAIKKRQEVGRGLRLCVDKTGERIDSSSVSGIDVHDINILSLIASESYEKFAKSLQKEIAETLSDRPIKADKKFFLDNSISNENGEIIKIDESLAIKIYQNFVKNDYVDEEDNITEEYHNAVKNGDLKVPEEFKDHKEALIELVSTIYSDTSTLINNERNQNVELKVNENFYKEEFQKLWNKINIKTVYTVNFDSKELINRCIKALDKKLKIADISYQVKDGYLGLIASKEALEAGGAFVQERSETDKIYSEITSGVRYDLVDKLLEETRLTRRTIVSILTGINEETFNLFKKNPEDFILKSSLIINEEKATTIIEKITYNPIEETYDTSVFTQNSLKGKAGNNAIPAKRHVYDYVITDSKQEKEFTKELDTSEEVCVYAKLPRGFFIPTPVGNYNPDWAIIFQEGKVKHVYFVAETKGSMESLELREIENAKIECAKKHFQRISNGKVKYDTVNSFEKLLELVR